jgi:hypothetical protein
MGWFGCTTRGLRVVYRFVTELGLYGEPHCPYGLLIELGLNRDQ